MIIGNNKMQPAHDAKGHSYAESDESLSRSDFFNSRGLVGISAYQRRNQRVTEGLEKTAPQTGSAKNPCPKPAAVAAALSGNDIKKVFFIS
jgi:hypothetical protein